MDLFHVAGSGSVLDAPDPVPKLVKLQTRSFYFVLQEILGFPIGIDEYQYHKVVPEKGNWYFPPPSRPSKILWCALYIGIAAPKDLSAHDCPSIPFHIPYTIH